MRLDLDVVVDNTSGWRLTQPHNGRRRDVYLSFELPFDKADSNYRIKLWGDAIPDDGAGAYTARVAIDRGTLHAEVVELLRTWQRETVAYTESGVNGETTWPYAERHNLWQTSGHRARLDKTMRSLARTGSNLFELLFAGDDWAMQQLRDTLMASLRSGQRLVTVQSDDLVIPWGLLYLPPTSGLNMDASDAHWDWTGFLGYSHLIEQNFTRARRLSPCICTNGARPQCGANVDWTIDTQFKGHACIGPVVDLLKDKTDLRAVRDAKEQLAIDVRSAQFKDEIMYFGCHGMGPGEDPLAARVELSDKIPIRTADFVRWLSEAPLTSAPLIYVNACQGGQMSAPFYTAMGRILLERGASCLLGPQVDIPPDFAREYARLFVTALAAGTRVGDAVQSATRVSAEQWGNPLGLTLSLYRGLDAHFCARQEVSASLSVEGPSVGTGPLTPVR